MKKSINHNTRNLSVAAFRAFGTDSERAAEQAAEEAENALRADYKSLYNSLVSGQVDYFYHESEPSKIGRSLVEVWTRSSRQGVSVQRSTFVRVPGGELVALSHHDIMTFSDMVKDSIPDNVEIIAA